MPRFYFRLTLIPIAFFTVVLILIHAQPYDDHELRELLLPEGCPAPCFIGIRPGITQMSEIIKTPHERILELQINTDENAQIVTSIEVKTSIRFGEIFLLLGGGLSNEHYMMYGQKARSEIIVYYPALELTVHSKIDCPISTQKYWNTTVNIHTILPVGVAPLDIVPVCPHY